MSFAPIETWLMDTRSWALNALGMLLTIALILGATRLLQSALARATRRLLRPRQGAKDFHQQERRAQTLLPLLLEAQRYILYFVAGVTILAQNGIDTGAILASVGVLGIAVGFGAQNLVKDVIGGFFLLFDGLIGVGDIIRLDEKIAGTVEVVGLRNTHIREFSGLLWVVPNDELRRFGNFNRGWMRAVVEVSLSHEADLQEAMTILQEVGDGWAAEFPEKVIEAPEVNALLSIGQTSMSLRLVIKLQPLEQWAAERELRRRIMERFDERGIELPWPRHVLIERGEKGTKRRTAS